MEAEPFYDEFASQEWDRLERHRTEFAVTLKALSEFMPAAPCSVLDIGGGPGRYAIELACLGYDVVLMDISKESLKLAKEKAEQAGVSIRAYVHGNALSASECVSELFDAVLLMGPLYHLLLKAERLQAVLEGMRILKPGGRFFASLITRFAPFRDSAKNIPHWLLENYDYALQMLVTGLHDKPTDWAKAYFTHPDEIKPLMESCGLKTLQLIGCEGIVAGHEEMVNELEGEAWEAWVELNYRFGMEPSLYGALDHLFYIGEKPG
jgi:S-adenosylmethionine-dependent methyltransferase